MGLYKYLGINPEELSLWLRLIINRQICVKGPRAALCPQHRPETVRQVCAGSEPGHGVRASLQAQVLGQADREGPGQLQEDARLGLRRQCDHAPQVPDPQEGGARAANVELTVSSSL